MTSPDDKHDEVESDDAIRERFDAWGAQMKLNMKRKGGGYAGPYADWCWQAFYCGTRTAAPRSSIAPTGYVIADKDGVMYWGEFCVSNEPEELQGTLDALQDDERTENRGFRIVPIYLAPPSATGSKWIPVSERLPSEDGGYLVYMPSQNAPETVSHFRALDNEWGLKYAAISHWMPLPSVPADGGNEQS